jgi:hypothetical protein
LDTQTALLVLLVSPSAGTTYDTGGKYPAVMISTLFVLVMVNTFGHAQAVWIKIHKVQNDISDYFLMS